jgi:hypothetical protein
MKQVIIILIILLFSGLKYVNAQIEKEKEQIFAIGLGYTKFIGGPLGTFSLDIIKNKVLIQNVGLDANLNFKKWEEDIMGINHIDLNYYFNIQNHFYVMPYAGLGGLMFWGNDKRTKREGKTGLSYGITGLYKYKNIIFKLSYGGITSLDAGLLSFIIGFSVY